jgi:ankyrin repeat protein
LFEATKAGSLPTLAFLLKQDGDVHRRTKYVCNTDEVAIGRGLVGWLVGWSYRRDGCRHLVDYYSTLLYSTLTINLLCRLGETCLHWAVREGRKDLIQLLLKHGADPGAVGENGSCFDLAPSPEIAAILEDFRVCLTERRGQSTQ